MTDTDILERIVKMDTWVRTFNFDLDRVDYYKIIDVFSFGTSEEKTIAYSNIPTEIIDRKSPKDFKAWLYTERVHNVDEYMAKLLSNDYWTNESSIKLIKPLDFLSTDEISIILHGWYDDVYNDDIW